jgi:hypothetical protein
LTAASAGRFTEMAHKIISLALALSQGSSCVASLHQHLPLAQQQVQHQEQHQGDVEYSKAMRGFFQRNLILGWLVLN